MEKKDKRYFIYVRKSTEGDSRQMLSIPAQIEEAKLLKERERLNVIDIISDSGSAMVPFNRPEYSKMIERIKKGEADGLIIWKFDRLARNHLEGGELIHLLVTGVITSIWTPQREYLSNESALLISLESSMASQYSVDLGVNVKRGLQRKIAIGQPPINAPLGYLNTKNGESGSNTILIDEVRWPLMRKAFELLLTRRYAIHEIASILNNDFNFRTKQTKTRPGSPISVSVLHRAFINPFYSGYYKYNGELHKGTYQPMITLEEYDTVQEILGRKQKAKPHKHHFAFTGLMTCSSCGCAITASRKLKRIKSSGSYKVYTFYHCTKRKGAGACANKRYVTELEMETLITAELKKIALIPEWKEWAFQTVKMDYDIELEKQSELLKATKNYENTLLNQLDNLLDLRINGQLSDEQYTIKKYEREAQIFRVQEKYKRLNDNIGQWIEAVKEKLDFAEIVVKKFENGDLQTKKDICKYIGSHWVLHGKNLLFTTHEWFNTLETLKSTMELEKERLEPIKTFETYRDSGYFQAVRPILSSLRDNIRAENAKDIKN